MDDIKTTTRRLTKKPPPGTTASSNQLFDVRNSYTQSLRSHSSSGSLQRAPSAPYPRSHRPQAHIRTPTSPNLAAYASSSSSLERQISGPSLIVADSNFAVTPIGQGGGKLSSNPTRTLSQKASDEFIGAPFDGSGILNHINSTKASGYQNAVRRPPPPPLSHTTSDPQLVSPPLTQSASFSAGDRMNEKTPPRVSENQLISPKRYSDETKEPKQGMIRKKSGFSGFMSSIGVSSPRGIKISAPENPVHVTHVGYDNQTGQFTVGLTLISREMDSS